MRSVLVHSGLWSVTSGELTATHAPEGVDWSAQDQKALATITLSVKTSQLAYIKNCQSSSDAYYKNEKEIIGLFLGVKLTINSCHIDTKIVSS